MSLDEAKGKRVMVVKRVSGDSKSTRMRSSWTSSSMLLASARHRVCAPAFHHLHLSLHYSRFSRTSMSSKAPKILSIEDLPGSEAKWASRLR
jgi:hypothetical protein